ncbi:MAG: DUF2177 family protein [Pseudolabrys sp.]|nr:DUF2177 family protein [Pseudolabrys sp.]
MHYLILYIAILVPFCALDAIWLMTMGPTLYKPTLGDILLSSPKFAPIIAFYAMFPLGLILFAVSPALRGGSVATAFILGAALGAFAYATYDLTNFATVRNWTLQITALDICWGAAISGLASVAGYMVTRAVGV